MTLDHRLSFRKDALGDIDLKRWLDEAESCPPVPGWLEAGLCKGRTALFYSEFRNDILDSVNYCKACPVSRPCARYAIESERYEPASHIIGVQAGLTAKQRKAAYNGGRQRGRSLWAS